MYHRFVKRSFDFIVAAIVCIVLLPALLILAVYIKLESPGPVLFKQKRTGKDMKPFYMYKFRTMIDTTPSEIPTNDFKNSYNYITKSGKILRRLGLDEIPQLINILKGEMSFIGPRPVILSETELIAERETYGANDCIPGITGWAQANGRDTVGITEKARMDGEYAQNFGLRMDFSCLVRTFVVLFNAKGYSEGSIEYDTYRKMVIQNTKQRGLSERVVNKLKRMHARYLLAYAKMIKRENKA